MEVPGFESRSWNLAQQFRYFIRWARTSGQDNCICILLLKGCTFFFLDGWWHPLYVTLLYKVTKLKLLMKKLAATLFILYTIFFFFFEGLYYIYNVLFYIWVQLSTATFNQWSTIKLLFFNIGWLFVYMSDLYHPCACIYMGNFLLIFYNL